MFIINLNYKVNIEIVDKFVVEHRKWLDKLYTDNKLLCSGPKKPRDGGIIIALLDDLLSVKELIAQDPFYINKIADYTIIDFCPNKFHQALKFLEQK